VASADVRRVRSRTDGRICAGQDLPAQQGVNALLTIVPAKSLLLIVDFQSRLMPSIDQGTVAVKNAKRLIDMAAEAGADLIVIGTHQWHGLSRLRHHSISRRLLHTSRTSIALVPGRRIESDGSSCISQARRILAPVDLSPHSGTAIPYALSSLGPGGTLVLFHVTISKEHAELRLRQLQELIPTEAVEHGYNVVVDVAIDVDPVKAICAAIERLDADLVCMSSRAPRNSSAALGLITQGVLAKTTRPVLVVPQHCNR